MLWHHFHSSSEPESPNLGATWPVWRYKGAPICPWDIIPMSQTLCKCLIWMSEAFWSGYQPQPWRCGIIFTPQVTLTSQIWGQLGRCNDVRVHPYSLETTYQWLKHYIYVIQMIWMWDTVNGGLQPQPWHHNIIQAQSYTIFPKITPTCTCITA